MKTVRHELFDVLEVSVIPNVFHFIFGMSEDFGGKPFSLVHYLAIKSAVEVNRPEKVMFHFQFEPKGLWWERIKPLLTLNQVEAPQEAFGNKLCHVAHKTDFLRLLTLDLYGGVYLDLDTICVKSLQHFREHQFVIGQEYRSPVYYGLKQKISAAFRRLSLAPLMSPKIEGLCNGVIMAAPKSAFTQLWLDRFKSFRSKGRDDHWNEFAVRVPFELAQQKPNLLEIIEPMAFHYPICDQQGLKMMFEEKHSFSRAYVHHLWESKSWNPYLSKLTVEDIRECKTTYATIACQFLKDLA